MTADSVTEVPMSRFLRLVRDAAGWGLVFAAAVGAVAAALKWLVGGLELRDAMVEALNQGFPFLGFLLGGAVATARALFETTANTAYRSGVGIALGAAFLMVWGVLAVGGIGAGGPPDMVFAGVLAVGFIGVMVSRFEPKGMARALFATATAQSVVPVIAVAAGWHRLPGASVMEIVLICAFFAAAFAVSGALFRKAAHEQRLTGAEQG